MTLESKENYPRHTKIVQNSLGFMPEVKPLHKPRGDLVLCALKTYKVWSTYAFAQSPYYAMRLFRTIHDVSNRPINITTYLQEHPGP